jgi:hypothetical protein
MWEQGFGLANGLALLAWAALIAAPRHRLLLATLRYGVIGFFALAYAVLVLSFFFRVEGGGFGSLGAVRTLFASPPVLLAGWLHYLAFDLFVGLAIARDADARGTNRLIQVPILVLTFMFGPIGLLVDSVIAWLSRPSPRPLA